MDMRPRVGIFQAEWPVQSQTFNCALMLGQAGFPVDLFLFDAPIYHELDRLDAIPNIQVHAFSRSDNAPPLARRTWRAIKEHTTSWPFLRFVLTSLVSGSHYLLIGASEVYARGRRDRERGLIPGWLVERAGTLMEGRRYACLIGIEKKGLIWAGLMGERMGIPSMYYSLELYTRDHPHSKRSLHARRTKPVEEKYHRKSLATIVQDPDRAEILLRDNGVQNSELFYVPVSLIGEPYRARSAFLRQRLRLPDDRRVILQFGQISEDRFSIELARVAQHFPGEWTLVLHGYGPERTVRRIRRVDGRGRVRLSLDLVPAHRVLEMVASADIGLALYSSRTANDTLTALSSEKVALYLQAGLPIIAFDYPGYRRLIDRYGCGATVSSLDQLPAAVEKILASYDRFRSNAYTCFTECFEFSRKFQQVIERIHELSDFSRPRWAALTHSGGPSREDGAARIRSDR
jgi:glycosyltransferase involved in cell wall biosynthesis